MEKPETRSERDTERFVVLLTESQPEILRYILAFVPDFNEAQEILQETAIALWRRFDQYDPSQAFVPWGCRFAFRHVLKHRQRKSSRRRYLSVEALERLADERAEQDELLQSRRRALGECLEKLSEDDRRLVEQRYIRRENFTDVARSTGRNLTTMYKALERVRRRLFECVNRSLRIEGLL